MGLFNLVKSEFFAKCVAKCDQITSAMAGGNNAPCVCFWNIFGCTHAKAGEIRKVIGGINMAGNRRSFIGAYRFRIVSFHPFAGLIECAKVVERIDMPAGGELTKLSKCLAIILLIVGLNRSFKGLSIERRTEHAD